MDDYSRIVNSSSKLWNDMTSNNYQIALHAVQLRDARQNTPAFKAEILE